MDPEFSQEALTYIVNHVALPPQLPQGREKNTAEGERALLALLLDHVEAFYGRCPPSDKDSWTKIRRALQLSVPAHNKGTLSSEKVKNALNYLGPEGHLFFHVAAQNAGFLIQRSNSDEVKFEAFEASARPADVIRCAGALTWCFPGCAVAVSAKTFEDKNFQAELAHYLERMSREAISEFQPQAHKGGSVAAETRDTMDPKLITEMLMSMLEALGKRFTPTKTIKHIRDDVCWAVGKDPWRRSPLWLVIRVGLQRALASLFGAKEGLVQYKNYVAFVLADICTEISQNPACRAETIAFVRSKLARRLYKLQEKDSLLGHLDAPFAKTLDIANARLNGDWSTIQRSRRKYVETVPLTVDSTNLKLSLVNSGVFLRRILGERLQRQLPSIPDLSCQPRGMLDIYALPVGHFDKLTAHELHLALADLESWVKSQLPGWMRSTQASDQVCQALRELMQIYENAALPAYVSNPQRLSLALLTIMDIWVALDQHVVHLYPKLQDYSPQLPSTALSSLLLATLSDMRRLQTIEMYLKQRQQLSHEKLPSVFADPAQGSFAARYYAQCEDMQRLKAKIIRDDTAKEVAKRQEWREKTDLYKATTDQARRTIHIWKWIWSVRQGRYVEVHDRECPKCALEDKASKLSISVNEPSLPADTMQAKAIVFELRCPQGFAAWRDATWSVINDLGQVARSTTDLAETTLRNYSGLKTYLQPSLPRLTLATRQKSILKTHYKTQKFPIEEGAVLQTNSLIFALFDTQTSTYTSQATEPPDFGRHCITTLPQHSNYSSLQFAVNYTRHTPNQVQASQSKCPSNIGIHEFLAFQDMRTGANLQWLRLLRELGSTNLDFSDEATHSLVVHIALQAGQGLIGDPWRVAHSMLKEQRFCVKLVQQIADRFNTIKANSRETHFMKSLIVILLRILSLGPPSDWVMQAQNLICDIREAVYEWMKKAREELHNAPDGDSARKRSREVLSAGLLCRRTFGAESSNGLSLMEASTLSRFIECAIVVHNNTPSSLLALSPQVRADILQDWHLAHSLEAKVYVSLSSSSSALTDAVNRDWPGTRQFSPWIFMAAPNERWATATTLEGTSGSQQVAHYNILDGRLLVDGRLLGRLPPEYTDQAIYKRIFGARVLETYPSDIPGLTYLTVSQVQGNQVHFGLRDGNIIIRARRNVNLFELVPHTVFKGANTAAAADLPTFFIYSCVHWLELNTGTLEIRPLSNVWQPSPQNWYLDVHNSFAHNGANRLVDPRSPIFNRIANIIEPFDSRHRMVLFQDGNHRLALSLPHYKMRFVVNDKGLLESAELRSVIDVDQNVGTLLGLETMLVLREARSGRGRSVLVPRGKVLIKPGNNHVKVSIDDSSQEKATYCRFYINEILHRLDCQQDLRDIYFKVFLHAITSFVLPDPLTGRTGTEEALHCLGSGSSQPWGPLERDAFDVLADIASLTARRSFYPTHLQAMQQVTWNGVLPASTQHDDFQFAVNAIVGRSNAFRQFYTQQARLPTLESRGDLLLLHRARGRNMLYQNPNCRVMAAKATKDAVYRARDMNSSNQLSSQVYQIASLVDQWSSNISATADLARALKDWGDIDGYNQPFDEKSFQELLHLRLASQWGALFGLCQRASRADDHYNLMFLFSTLAFGESANMPMLRTLLAVAFMPRLKSLHVPEWQNYIGFGDGENPKESVLYGILQPRLEQYIPPIRAADYGNLPELQRLEIEEAATTHAAQLQRIAQQFVSHLLQQWPVATPSLAGFDSSPLLDDAEALEIILPEWERVYHNYELSKHVRDVQESLDICQVQPLFNPSIVKPVDGEAGLKKRLPASAPALTELVKNQGPTIGRHANSLVEGVSARHTTFESEVKPEHVELREIIKATSSSTNQVRREYGMDLMRSLDALQDIELRPKQIYEAEASRIASSIDAFEELVHEALRSLISALQRDERFPWLGLGGYWPRITPVTLLETLRGITINNCSSSMLEAILVYGERITALQRFTRLERALQTGDLVRFEEEARNKGHEDWQPLEYPEWLLIEIESNVLIRPEQYQVAMEMISPSSGKNSVLQFNMGKGKSSLIIPMIVAVLSDSTQIIRVVVPRPLLLQMAQLLSARTGGLLGRPMYHFPFSRSTATDPGTIQAFRDLYSESQRKRGIVLSLPEHMLSFKLSGLERLASGNIGEGALMLQTQHWLERTCRDILDECDHTLAVRTQLIYPSGSQSMIDGHPNRWRTSQAILHLVRKSLPQLHDTFPNGLEVDERSRGGFPGVHILRKDVEDALISKMTKEICKCSSSILPLQSFSDADLDHLKAFVSDSTYAEATAGILDSFGTIDNPARKEALLLRGLLASRILLLAFNKRWNVQYGLHPTRCLIAVPYLAKGVPSAAAEFGHPDVAILLTCLSYYYAGLSQTQLIKSLEKLLLLDDPSVEYDQWVYSCGTLPENLQSWNAINLEDEVQANILWQHLSHTMVTVDFFVNHFVFPKEAKEFEKKLVTSGWDIPLDNSLKRISNEPTKFAKVLTGRVSDAGPLTTGFSGTNDNRSLLPLPIQQRDLSNLAHTNAEVLTFLLQSRNRKYVCPRNKAGKRPSEPELLGQIADQRPPIRVILDAGAQVLEMSNQDLVKLWLKFDRTSPAAVYFDEGDHLMVQHQDGRTESLSASPYVDDLGACLVYLDEAHTRGTDLKLPLQARAALTIGPGQTKDHTVQAAMRLRQLGHLQSVVFLAPPEVHQSILDLTGKVPDASKAYDGIDSADVVRWLIEQACRYIETYQPLYVSQGLNFCRRRQAARDRRQVVTDEWERKLFLKVLEEPEQHTLEELYAPRGPSLDSHQLPTGTAVQAYVTKLVEMRQAFSGTVSANHASAHEEQERELAVEVEKERQVLRPAPAKAANHKLLEDVVTFVKSGSIVSGSHAYENAFGAVRKTTFAGTLHGEEPAVGGRFLASADHLDTIKLPTKGSGQSLDHYQRPVNWVLWSKKSNTAMVISPYEAEHLLEKVQASQYVHLLTYAAPVTRKMLHFDNLNFFTIPELSENWVAPSWLVRALGLFAGRLYFKHEEYPPLCTWLRQPLPSADRDNNKDSERNKENEYPTRKGMPKEVTVPATPIQPFSQNPLPFVQEWLGIRRGGQDITQTPMGYICRSRILTSDHIFFAPVQE